jgi:uncharacterized membrane protein
MVNNTNEIILVALLFVVGCIAIFKRNYVLASITWIIPFVLLIALLAFDVLGPIVSKLHNALAILFIGGMLLLVAAIGTHSIRKADETTPT